MYGLRGLHSLPFVPKCAYGYKMGVERDWFKSAVFCKGIFNPIVSMGLVYSPTNLP